MPRLWTQRPRPSMLVMQVRFSSPSGTAAASGVKIKHLALRRATNSPQRRPSQSGQRERLPSTRPGLHDPPRYTGSDVRSALADGAVVHSQSGLVRRRLRPDTVRGLNCTSRELAGPGHGIGGRRRSAYAAVAAASSLLIVPFISTLQAIRKSAA
jgi:hypothetical protein